jgi:hypothetical protein
VHAQGQDDGQCLCVAADKPCAENGNCVADAEGLAQTAGKTQSIALRERILECSDDQLNCCPGMTQEDCLASDKGVWCGGEDKCIPKNDTCLPIVALIVVGSIGGVLFSGLLIAFCCCCRARKGASWGASGRQVDPEFAAYHI